MKTVFLMAQKWILDGSGSVTLRLRITKNMSHKGYGLLDF